MNIVVIISLLIISCMREKPPKQQTSTDKTQNVATDSIPILWSTICQNSDFPYLFDCSKENCYQVELLNDPFKDLVVITLNLNDSLNDIIRFNRFSFKFSRNYANDKNKLNKVYPIINSITKDTIFCIHENTKTLKIEKQHDLDYFFSTTIWQIPTEDKSPNTLLDGESWKVKGRNREGEISVVRWNFSDTIYYGNIQKLLDLFKINEYKFKTR